MKLKIPNFTFKAINPSDDVYVDEQGRHIIFRTINGQVVPIRTDSEGYASWLKNQGIDIDPADQKTLRELDKQLDVFDRAREAGGPELQEEYQKAFEKQLKNREKIVRQYYQQALQNQAERQNTTPENLQEQKQKTYQEHKDKTISRTSLEDRGWSSYVKQYVNTMIEESGATPDEMIYFVFQAFDLIGMKAIEKAKEGVSPSQVDIEELISDELETSSGFNKLYNSRYKEIAEEKGFDSSLYLSNMRKSLRILQDNFSKNTEGAKELESGFDSMYRKMHDDFNPSLEEEFEEIPSSAASIASPGSIPEDLPANFSSSEASALKGFYSRMKRGSVLNKTHNIALHSLSRLFESLPEEDKISAVVDITDSNSGLHRIHNSSYKLAYTNLHGLGIDVDPEESLDQILRISAKAGSGNTTDKINAMKKIAQVLGSLDGAQLARTDDKGYQSHASRWGNTSMYAGRAKGDGPDLYEQILDEQNRAANIYPNSILKIPHGEQKTQPEKTPDTEELPQKEKPSLGKNEVHPGFFSREGTIYNKDGYYIEIDGSNWSVFNPDNEKIGVVSVSKAQTPSDLEKVKDKAFRNVQSVIDNHERDQRTLEEDVSTPSVFTPFDFDVDLTESEQSILDGINPGEYDISVITPGRIYRVSQGDKSLDIVYSKDKLLFAEKMEDGGLNTYEPTESSIQDFFGAEQNEETTNVPTEDRQPSTPEESTQRNRNVMLWNTSKEDFQKLINSFDYEDTGIFWTYNPNNETYAVSLPKNVRDEFTSTKSVKNKISGLNLR